MLSTTLFWHCSRGSGIALYSAMAQVKVAGRGEIVRLGYLFLAGRNIDTEQHPRGELIAN